MSLARKIIQRLMITTLLGTGVAYGWLYLKAAHVQSYLEQRALVQQAREISDFIAVGDNGDIALNLPPRLSEAAPPALRKALWDGGMAAVAASDDPMIQFVLKTDPLSRAARQVWEEEVEGRVQDGGERIGISDVMSPWSAAVAQL